MWDTWYLFSSFPTRFPTLLFSKFWIPDIPYIKFSLHGHIGPYTINSHTRHYKTSKSYTNPNKTKDVWDCLYACEFRTYWDAGASKKYHLLHRSSCTQYFHISVKKWLFTLYCKFSTICVMCSPDSSYVPILLYIQSQNNFLGSNIKYGSGS